MPAPRPAAASVERRRPPVALARRVNLLVRRLLAKGTGGGQLLVLHFHGRRTGRAYDVPVRYHVADGVVTVLTDSAWRHKFASPTDLTVTIRGVRQPYRAWTQDDANEVAAVYEALIRRLGPRAARRRLGLRMRQDGAASRDDLADMVRRNGLAAVRLEPVELHA